MSDENGNSQALTLPEPIHAPLPALRSPELDDAALEAFKRMGLGKVSPDTILALAAIGSFAEGVGMLRTQRGNAVVTQQWLHEQMRAAGTFTAQLVDKDQPKLKLKDKCAAVATLSRAMAELAREMTAASKAVVENEKASNRGGVEEPVPAPNFQPGIIIRPRQEPQTQIITEAVHFHGQAEQK